MEESFLVCAVSYIPDINPFDEAIDRGLFVADQFISAVQGRKCVVSAEEWVCRYFQESLTR